MASIFTKIINGELPCYKIFEDDQSISFLALDQVTRGHTLVVPKVEVDHWVDVPEEIFLKVQANARVIAKAVQKYTEAPRILTATIGFEVPHYHLHLVPGKKLADLDFTKGKRLPVEEMEKIQKGIISFLKSE